MQEVGGSIPPSSTKRNLSEKGLVFTELCEIKK